MDTHVLTDNTSRSMMRDNVVKLYLGETTIENLPQAPKPTSAWIRALIRSGKENYTSKMRYWHNDMKSHASHRTPGYVALPETGIKQYTQYRVNEDAAASRTIWEGALKDLSVFMGMTAPTLIQSIMPLAMAVFEHQGTGVIPDSVCYMYCVSARTGVVPPVPGSEQLRGYGVAEVPFSSMLSLAKHSLWLHMAQASLKLDNTAKHYHVEASAEVRSTSPVFVWREVADGSAWSSVIEAGAERFSAEVLAQSFIVCMRLGINTLMMIDSSGQDYVEWRSRNGYPVSLVTVLQRCLTFLCDNREDVVSLTLDDLIKAVWAQ